jgi:hypothetical protein
MKSKVEKKLSFLSIYAVFSTLLIAVLFFLQFNNFKEKISIEELDVKRINLLSEEGALRMVLSNESRQHPGRVNGKEMPKRDRPAGILFFNTEGDECGGLIYYGNNTDGETESGMSFTMDQYHNDQVIQILNSEYYNGKENEISRGISINDIPLGLNLDETMDKYEQYSKIEDATVRDEKIKELFEKEGSKRRLFMGKTSSDKTGLFLADEDGNYRLKIYVDKQGNACFETINDDGSVKNHILQ